jgi:hypothetical protein
MQAIGEIIDILGSRDKGNMLLQHAVCQLYLALICQIVGSVPFKLPVLSFCAILARKVRGKGQGLWEELGNFNSHLSVLT